MFPPLAVGDKELSRYTKDANLRWAKFRLTFFFGDVISDCEMACLILTRWIAIPEYRTRIFVFLVYFYLWQIYLLPNVDETTP